MHGRKHGRFPARRAFRRVDIQSGHLTLLHMSFLRAFMLLTLNSTDLSTTLASV